LKTSSIYGRLRRVFSTSENKQLHERLARLIVLYEDLRLETSGMTNKEELPKLDDSGFAARQSYFLRRTFGTLSEFAEAIRLTETCREFLTILKPDAQPRRHQDVGFRRRILQRNGTSNQEHSQRYWRPLWGKGC
jgi:hypothetical protein